MKTTPAKKSAGGNHSTAHKQPAKAAKKKESKPGKDVAEGLNELFEDELKDIYWAEKALLKAMPKMIKNASSEELANAIESHMEETEGQVKRIEQAFKMMDKKAEAKKCEAMAGLLKEAGEIMEETEEGPVRDAGIISAAQKVEHYEIASYGTLCAFARILGLDDVASLLEETLNEEKNADEKLTEVAESAINIEAHAEDEKD